MKYDWHREILDEDGIFQAIMFDDQYSEPRVEADYFLPFLLEEIECN